MRITPDPDRGYEWWTFNCIDGGGYHILKLGPLVICGYDSGRTWGFGFELLWLNRAPFFAVGDLYRAS